MSAEFVVAVDLTNPGRNFACCGLLERARRMWPGALLQAVDARASQDEMAQEAAV